MQGFQRLHAYLNPQALYFPTALPIKTLARRELAVANRALARDLGYEPGDYERGGHP